MTEAATTPAAAPAAPSAPSTPAEGGAAPAANSNTPWFSGFQNQEIRGYAEMKGWQSAEAAIDSYRNLERTIGREKLIMPKDANDKEGWAQVWDKLGRPKAANEYGIEVPEGGNAKFVEAMTSLFHEHGLTTAQARAIVEGNNKWAADAKAAADQAFVQQAQAGLNDIKTEWAGNYDKYAAAGQRAAHLLGLDKPTMSKIERAIGTKQMMTMMATIGVNLAEDNFDGNDAPGALNSAEAAKARKSELMKDKDFVGRYNRGDAAAREEMRKLNEAINHYQG